MIFIFFFLDFFISFHFLALKTLKGHVVHHVINTHMWGLREREGD